MNKKSYVQRAMSGLRRADGVESIVIKDSKSVVSGLTDQFTFSVQNEGSTVLTAALLVGHYDTSSFPVSGSSPNFTVIKNYFSPVALNQAGYNVNVCADDGTYKSEDGTWATFTAADPSKSIRSFLDYMRNNPRPLKGLQISANGSDNFQWGNTLTVTASSPFSTPQQKTIHLRDFFSAYQYQKNLIDIDFTANELEISDITMLFATIPTGVTLTFTLRF